MTGTERLGAESPAPAKLYLERDMREIELVSFYGGTAAVFSMRSPTARSTNQDAAGLVPFDARSGAMIVADGAGGLAGGGQASNLTVEEFRASLERSAGSGGSLREAILQGIECANREVVGLGIGAATTVAVVELREGRMRTFHAGDTQILVVSADGELQFLTVAHSPTGYAEQMGLLDERQAMAHEDRHLLFNVVGIPDLRIEMGMERELSPGDTVLIACDGLFDNLAPSEVVPLLRRGPIAETAKGLVERCLERMGGGDGTSPSKPDDLTVIVYRFGE